MTMQSFQAAIRQEAGLVIIDLQGEINAFADQELQAAYAKAEGGSTKKILLNFRQVSYINSTGIAIIVSLLAKALRAKRSIVRSVKQALYRNISNHAPICYIEIYPDEGCCKQQGKRNHVQDR
jgi:anti-anti-sigma factor